MAYFHCLIASTRSAVDTSELEDLQAKARAYLKTLTDHGRDAHIAQKRHELAETIKQLNEQLVNLAVIDMPIRLRIGEIGITRRRENIANAKVTMSPVAGYIQIFDVTDIPNQPE
jgi:hypothetical protein